MVETVDEDAVGTRSNGRKRVAASDQTHRRGNACMKRTENHPKDEPDEMERGEWMD